MEVASKSHHSLIYECIMNKFYVAEALVQDSGTERAKHLQYSKNKG